MGKEEEAPRVLTRRFGRVVITGASSGIGRALAVAMSHDATSIVAIARRAEPLESLRNEIQGSGCELEACVLDVGDTSQTVRCLRAIDDERPVHTVIANAGIGPPNDRLDWEALGEVLQVNFMGATATLTALSERMRARRRGHLVGICSLSSFGALPRAAAYCTPKAGLSMLLDCMRLDLASDGVAVTTVNPGFVKTRMVEHTEFKMPMIMSADRAAAQISRRLADRPATIDFPQPLAAITRLASLVPTRLRDALVRRAARAADPADEEPRT